MPIPHDIQGQRYINLITFRKTGVPVSTPVWFGEENGKLYVMSQPDSGKCKRIRNNPFVKIAPATIRGKTKGPEIPAKARILPTEAGLAARASINRKYWAARLPIWSKKNVYLEIEFG